MGQVVLNPYLNFYGNAEDVLNFYKTVFGGELVINRFSDTPGMPVAEEQKNQVMHGQLESAGMTLMASDAMSNDGNKQGEVSISLSGDDAETLTKYFEALSEGGKIDEPLKEAPWGDTFGMLVDKFGVRWLFNIAGPKPESN